MRKLLCKWFNLVPAEQACKKDCVSLEIYNAERRQSINRANSLLQKCKEVGELKDEIKYLKAEISMLKNE